MDTNSSTATLVVEGDIGVVTIDYPPVNALSRATREGILNGMRAANADPAIKAVVLICAGRTFLAGADISEFGKPPQPPSLMDAQDEIEQAGKPVIAAIHGTALGGGLEVALCCHYRVAVPSAKCGLPEVHLGLLPGAGGTQRLPRIVGVAKALEMVTAGSHVRADECLAMGLVDAIVPEGSLRSGAIAFAQKVLDEHRPLRRVRDSNEKLLAARDQPSLFADFRQANARKFRGFLAPEYNIRCIEAAVNSANFDEGKATERRLFLELVTGEQSIAQRYAFFAERRANKIPDLPDDTPTVRVAKVGIIGAGTMGGGIAMNFVNVGIPVTLVETAQAALDKGLAVVRRNYENSAKRGRFTPEQVEQRMGLLSGSLALESLADCDLVIEAVFENMAVKQDIFAKLDRIVKAGAVLATNTSALDVNQIASATTRPEAVIGLHFFSPANVMRLLEVVRGTHTSHTVIATAMQIAKKIGKVAVLSGVCPGFIGNRILAARSRQAQAMVLEGAMPWDIDRVLYDFGMPMGPFAMSDLAGLDIGWSRETSTGATVRERLCEQDRRGQKTGAGYYDYDAARNASPSDITRNIIAALMAEQGRTARAISDTEILERCNYAMVNEAAKILDEGIALRASDIDVVWVNGYGWPQYRGGPMHCADSVGLDKIVAALGGYGERMGAGFEMSPLLLRLAAQGQHFTR